MSFSSNALYQALLSDLREHLKLNEKERRYLVSLDSAGRVSRHWRTIKISPEFTPKEAASVLLLQAIFKKYNASDETTEAQNAVAIEKFVKTNDGCANWEYSPNTSGDEELMGSVQETIYHFWNPQGLPLVGGYYDLYDRGAVGPGSSISARGEDYYTKMWSSPLSATSEDLLTHYEWWCSEKPIYAHAESHRRTVFWSNSITKQNRVSFVPKDDVTSRTIATEPSLNMFMQRGLGEILEDRLRSHFGISLSFQPEWNREAARIGSTAPGEEPGLVTIDLSAASDSLSLKAARWLLPRDFMNLLGKLRCTSGVLPDGRTVEYHMVSTMGNGFTFPLQTLVFSSIVVSCIRSFGLTPDRPNSRPPRNHMASWGVFGDDIICHPQVARRVLRLLGLFGFTVNTDKTFVEGPFRESCGRDYFCGHDIRGVYLKRPLASRADLHSAINAFTAWSYRTGILLPAAGRYLCHLLKEYGRILYVPLDEGVVGGVRVPMNLLDDLIIRRQTNRNGSFLYRRLLAAPKQLRIGDGFITVPKGERWRVFNPEGLLLAFLHGSVRTGRISIRQKDTRYRVKGCVTPNWDYVAPTSDLLRHVGDRLDQRRLEIVSRVFLGELILV